MLRISSVSLALLAGVLPYVLAQSPLYGQCGQWSVIDAFRKLKPSFEFQVVAMAGRGLRLAFLGTRRIFLTLTSLLTGGV